MMVQKKRTRGTVTQKSAHITRLEKKMVHCKFCKKLVPLGIAHSHDGGWVGPECWDERLRPTS